MAQLFFHGRFQILVPVSLTTFRLLLAPTVIVLAANGCEGWSYVFILLAALLSDLYDGVAARRLNVSYAWLRRYDSATDVVFWLSVLGAVSILRQGIVKDYAYGLISLLVMEGLCNLTSFIKNRSLPATHSYLAKGWAIILAFTFAVVLGWGVAWPLLDVCIGYGLLVDFEVIAIILLMPGPAIDVPTCWHAWQHRRRPPC
jgi:CDP-diacylglycerol--glycerol-3-phosphate 3-phosphatidyltransferase